MLSERKTRLSSYPLWRTPKWHRAPAPGVQLQQQLLRALDAKGGDHLLPAMQQAGQHLGATGHGLGLRVVEALEAGLDHG